MAKGTSTELSCTVSDLTKETTIKWFYESDELKSNTTHVISAVNNIGTDESQMGTLTVENPTKSDNFICRVSSNLYPDSPYSDSAVSLYVYGEGRIFNLIHLLIFDQFIRNRRLNLTILNQIQLYC